MKNAGFSDKTLLDFLNKHPLVSGLMLSQGLVFSKQKKLVFPSTVSVQEESQDPELAARAFHLRVARHTISVGITMNLLLTSLKEVNILPMDESGIRLATEVMALHDLKKVEEINLRDYFDSQETAYDIAQSHLAGFLKKSGFSDEYVVLVGSIGHIGARDYLTAPGMWSLPRICAYLADELVQENIIQTDILAKTNRLRDDIKYKQLNLSGFPERKNNPLFMEKSNKPKAKFVIQALATQMMASEVGSLLEIPADQLGNYLIERSVNLGLYEATIA